MTPSKDHHPPPLRPPEVSTIGRHDRGKKPNTGIGEKVMAWFMNNPNRAYDCDEIARGLKQRGVDITLTGTTKTPGQVVQRACYHLIRSDKLSGLKQVGDNIYQYVPPPQGDSRKFVDPAKLTRLGEDDAGIALMLDPDDGAVYRVICERVTGPVI